MQTKQILVALVLAFVIIPLLGQAISPEEAQRILQRAEEEGKLDAYRKGGVPEDMPELAKLDNATKDALIQGLYVRLSKCNQLSRDMAELRKSYLTLDNEKQFLQTKLEEAQNKLQQLLPGKQVDTADGRRIITVQQIEATGERYVGKGEMKMTDVTVNKLDIDFVRMLPADIQGRGELDWMNLFISDSERKSYLFCFAKKDKFADLLLSLNRNSRVNLIGVVVKLNDPNRYGFICTKIELIHR